MHTGVAQQSLPLQALQRQPFRPKALSTAAIPQPSNPRLFQLRRLLKSPFPLTLLTSPMPQPLLLSPVLSALLLPHQNSMGLLRTRTRFNKAQGRTRSVTLEGTANLDETLPKYQKLRLQHPPSVHPSQAKPQPKTQKTPSRRLKCLFLESAHPNLRGLRVILGLSS